MSAIEQEVASQPAVWREAARLDAGDVLPRHGERVGVVGCGTSFYIAAAYAAAREAAGLGETDAFPASEFPTGRAYDRVLAVAHDDRGARRRRGHRRTRPDGRDHGRPRQPAGPGRRAGGDAALRRRAV